MSVVKLLQQMRIESEPAKKAELQKALTEAINQQLDKFELTGLTSNAQELEIDLENLFQVLKAGNIPLPGLPLKDLPLSEKSIELLAAFLKENNSLKIISLGNTKITDTDLKSLLEALKVNTTLELLFFNENDETLSKETVAEIKKYLTANRERQARPPAPSAISTPPASSEQTPVPSPAVPQIKRTPQQERILKIIKSMKETRSTEVYLRNLSQLKELLKNLQTLDLSKQGLDDEDIACLSEALVNHQTLQKLHLANNKIGSKGMRYLSEALKTARIIQEITLLGNDAITAKDISDFVTTLKIDTGNTTISLTRLDLMTLAHAPVGHPPLAKFGDTSRIINLLKSMREGKKDNTKIKQLKEELRGVKSLDLSNKKLDNEDVSNLCEALVDSELEALDLSDNQISTIGISSLVQALKNTPSITSLLLVRNQITSDDAMILAKALKDTQIVSLELDHNKIGPKGAQAFAQALANNNNKLKTLRLMSNQIDYQSAVHLLKSLENNTILESLVLIDNPLGDQAEKIIFSLENNVTLKTLYITDQHKNFIALREPDAQPISSRSFISSQTTSSKFNLKKIGYPVLGFIIGALIGGAIIALIGLAWPISVMASIALITALLGGGIAFALSKPPAPPTPAPAALPVLSLSKPLSSIDVSNTILRYLHIIRNDKSPSMKEAAAQELENLLQHSTEINLRATKLDDVDIINLSKAFKKNSPLISLDLSGNNISSNGIESLSKTLTKNAKQLETLNLDSNKIDARGVRSIAAMLSTVKLKSLMLAYNQCGEGIRELVEQIRTDPNTHLEMLNLSKNNINTIDAMFIVRLLESNQSLKTLNLYGNTIGSRHAQEEKPQRSDIAKKMVVALINNKNTQLKNLNLTQNAIQPDEANEILNFLKDTNINVEIDGRSSLPFKAQPPVPPAPPSTVVPPIPEPTPNKPKLGSVNEIDESGSDVDELEESPLPEIEQSDSEVDEPESESEPKQQPAPKTEKNKPGN